MSFPEDIIMYPTDSPMISPIENPTAKDLYSLFGDLVLDAFRLGIPVNDSIRKNISDKLDASLFENDGVAAQSELWATGINTISTCDSLIIRDMIPKEVIAEDGMPDMASFAVESTDQVQGFVNSMSVGPVMDFESEGYVACDFRFCMNLRNIVIVTAECGYEGRQPEFLPGDWLVEFGNQPQIGMVL